MPLFASLLLVAVLGLVLLVVVLVLILILVLVIHYCFPPKLFLRYAAVIACPGI